MPPRAKANAALVSATKKGSDFDKVEKQARLALLGYAKLDLFGTPALEFGLWNPRGLNTAEGNKLYKSMLEHGIQRFSVENAIPVIVRREWLSINHLGKPSRKEDWPEVKWTEAGKSLASIKALGGRHRQYALKEVRTKMKNDVDKVFAKISRVEKGGVPNAVLRAEYDLKTKEYTASGKWLVALYDLEKAQDNHAAIARHLSKNQTKHLYGETSGERLVSMLQAIVDTEGSSTVKRDEAIMNVQAQAKSLAGGSKYSGFFSNTDTIDLYLRFMVLPDEYRSMDAVSLKWGLDHFRADYGGFLHIIITMGLNVLENIFTRKECKNEETIKKMFTKAKAAGKDDREKLLKPLKDLYGTLLARPNPDRDMLSSSVIRQIDNEFINCLANKSPFIGSRQQSYGTALSNYNTGIRNILAGVVEKYKDKDASTKNPSDKSLIATNILGKFELYAARIDDVALPRVPLYRDFLNR